MADNRIQQVIQQLRELLSTVESLNQTRVNEIFRDIGKSLKDVDLEGFTKELQNLASQIQELSNRKIIDTSQLEKAKNLFSELNKEVQKGNLAAKNSGLGVPTTGASGLGNIGQGPNYGAIVSDKEKIKTLTDQELEAQRKIRQIVETSLPLYKQKAEYERQTTSALQALGLDSLGGGLTPQAGLGDFIAGDNPYVSSIGVENKISAVLDSYGLSLENITSVQKDARTGITNISAALADEAGRVTTAEVSIDRLGNVTTKSAGAFRTLADNISHSVAQFAKFIVSATLVYGALSAVQEQFETLIKNEAELANIGIVLGNSQSKLNDVFESAAEAATLTSTSINGVLEGYQQAIRATGNAETQYERLGEANQFLTESLVLSRLSTLDQAKSMDIMVAALRQADIEIENARDLLDRWVATTKVANVDMRTLAESYAIVATVAKSAGIEVQESNNELVGLIAVLAEQTQLTPTETGNALRAAITGLNTDSAVRELRKFGISITTAEGDVRGFLDVIGQLNSLYEQGIIDDASITKIARAIGGGTRRQAQVEILIKNLDRAMEINAETSGQYGAAQEALAIQTDTLQDAVTRLGNALQELAQTLGTDGGILELATSVVEVFTDLVGLMDRLSGTIGGSALGLLTLGGASAISRSRGRFLGEGLANRIDEYTTRPGVNLPTGAGGYSYGQWGAGVAGAGLGVAIPAVGNLLQGDTAQGFGNIIGGTIGGAIGGYLGGPPGVAIGATVGSSIGEAFVNVATSDAEDVGLLIYEAYKKAQSGDTEVPPPEEEGAAPISGTDVLTALGGGREWLGGLKSSAYIGGASIANFLGGEGTLGNITPAGQWAQILGRTEWGQGLFEQAGNVSGMSQEDAAIELLRLNQPEQFAEYVDKVQRDKLESGEGLEPDDSRFYALGEGIVTENAQIIEQTQQRLLSDLLSSLGTGDISERERGYRQDIVEGLPTLLATALPATLEEGQLDLSGDLLNTADAIAYVADTFVGATEDEQARIGTLIADIKLLSDKIQAENALQDTNLQTIDELTQKQGEYRDSLNELIKATHDRIETEKYVVPNVVKTGGKLTEQGVQRLLELLPSAQEAYQNALYTSTEAQEAYVESLKDIILDLGDFDYQNLDDLLKGAFDPTVVAQVFQQLADEVGNIVGESDFQNPGFIDLPFSPGGAEAAQFWGQYQQLLAQLQTLGYQEDVTDTIAVYGDKQLELISKDNTIIQMLLSGIEDNTSDMVDGIYNLPTDGTFFVPWTGAATAVNQGGGTGGLGGYSSIGGGPPTVDENQIAEIMASPDGGTYESRRDAMLEYFYDQTRAELSGGASTFGEDSYESRREELQNQYQQGDETSLKFSGNELTADKMATIMDGVSSSIANTLLGSPVNVVVDISATFETFIDGQSVAEISKKFITEEMIRERNTQGTQITATI